MNLILTLENFEKTLAEVKKNDSARNSNIKTKYEGFIEKLQLMVKTQSVGLHLERAQKNYVNEKEISEKDLLFNAYCKIKGSDITDEDLRTANLQDYTTGNNLTLASIEQRLTALGWKE